VLPRHGAVYKRNIDRHGKYETSFSWFQWGGQHRKSFFEAEADLNRFKENKIEFSTSVSSSSNKGAAEYKIRAWSNDFLKQGGVNV
jgi:hypothetical protein